MIDTVLVAFGAAIFGVLGTLHLLYTFFTPKFDPRDPTLAQAMRATSPRITRHTTMWKAWIGFNASHSLGAMLFAAFYLVLAIQHPELLRDTKVFLVLGLVTTLAYLALGFKYWFRIPITGIFIAAACFAVATIRAFL